MMMFKSRLENLTTGVAPLETLNDMPTRSPTSSLAVRVLGLEILAGSTVIGCPMIELTDGLKLWVRHRHLLLQEVTIC